MAINSIFSKTKRYAEYILGLIYRAMREVSNAAAVTLVNPYVYTWFFYGVTLTFALAVLDSIPILNIVDVDLSFLTEPAVVATPFFVAFFAICANSIAVELIDEHAKSWLNVAKRLKQLSYDLWWATTCYMVGLAMVYGLFTSNWQMLRFFFAASTSAFIVLEAFAEIKPETSFFTGKIERAWLKFMIMVAIMFCLWCILVALLIVSLSGLTPT